MYAYVILLVSFMGEGKLFAWYC